MLGFGGQFPAAPTDEPRTARSARAAGLSVTLILAIGALLAGGGALASAAGGGWHVLRSSPVRSFYGPPMCVGRSACWVPSSGGTVVASVNGGRSWKVWTAAPGRDVTHVWCTSAQVCWATVNSTRYGHSVKAPIIGSTDGGHHWRAARVRGHITVLDGLSCASSTFCMAVGGAPVGPGIPLMSQLAVSTTDGGRTWTVIPHLDYQRAGVFADTHMYAISCPSAGVCFAAGLHGVCTRGACSGNTGAVLATFDGGQHWHFQRVPGGTDLFWDVACASRRDCWAVGRTGEGPADHGVIIVTTDAGKHWRFQAPPPGTLSMDGISCADVSHCTSMGFRRDYSSVIATTSDGGRHWVQQSRPPGATMWSSVWCSTSTDCLGPATYRYPNGPFVLATG